MEHVAAFMILIACSDDLQVCEEKPTSQIAYETVERCERDVENQISVQDLMTPVVVAKCVHIDPSMMESDLEIAWSFSDEELRVSLDVSAGSALNEFAQVN